MRLGGVNFIEGVGLKLCFTLQKYECGTDLETLYLLSLKIIYFDVNVRAQKKNGTGQIYKRIYT